MIGTAISSQIKEIAGIIEDRFSEDFGVADCDNAARELTALHPHRRIGGLHAGRLAHFHDGRLNKAQSQHVAAHPSHRDTIADCESRPAQDDEIARDCRHNLLQSKREAGGHETEGSREPGRVVEPDRQQTEDQDERGDQTDALARPEPGLDRRVIGAAEDQPDQRAQDYAAEHDDPDEHDREQKFASVLGVDPDPIDPKEMHAAPKLIAAGAGLGQMRGVPPAARPRLVNLLVQKKSRHS